MDELAQDFRFAVRLMRRNRMAAGIAIATPGMGIAACTAMFR